MAPYPQLLGRTRPQPSPFSMPPSPVGPPPVGSPPRPASAATPRRRRWIVALALLVVAATLVAFVVVVVHQRQRDRQQYEAAHTTFAAARCEAAVESFDELLAASRLFGNAGVTDPAIAEREVCLRLLDLDAAAADDPSVALLGYSALIGELTDLTVADTPVADVVPAIRTRGAALVAESELVSIATEATCDRLDEIVGAGIVAGDTADPLRGACASAYLAAGRSADARALATEVLSSTTDDVLSDQMVDVVLSDPAACTDFGRIEALPGVFDDVDRLATFLQRCMDEVTSAGDGATAAALQVEFLSKLPDHTDAPAIEAAVLANPDACALTDTVLADPAIAARTGFLATFVLGCAQVAEYTGDTADAARWYQWFLDHVPLEARSAVALDGLARTTIALAAGSGAGELPTPAPAGTSGSASAEVTIANDTPYDLRVVVSGPESRILVVPASPTSSPYSVVGPLSCRTDVPTVDLTLVAGTYDVLVATPDSSDIGDYLGSWDLAGGDAYLSCFFIVTTFG